MSVNPNEDTEFNDALRKYGILPPREPTPPTPPPPPSPTLEEFLDKASLSELRELGEDALNDDTERAINAYRRQRIAELREEQNKAVFGRVYPIGRDDYTREVTDASKVSQGDDSAPSTAVVCFLYQSGIPRSDRAFDHIRELAARYPRTKFVSIVGNKCIPNLPDSRTPMFIIYKSGEIVNQVVSWGADRERSIKELEALLMVSGAISDERRRHDPDDESDSDDDVPSRTGLATIHTKQGKPFRTLGREDDSDEFEFDL